MSRPWFKFWISDWRSSVGVRLLSKPARSDFLDLLLLMYEGKDGFCSRPDGAHLTRRQIVAVTGIDDASIGEMVDAGVVELKDGLPFCPKVAAVLKQATEREQKYSEAGRKAAAARWDADRNADRTKNKCGSHSESDADLMPAQKLRSLEDQKNKEGTLTSTQESQPAPEGTPVGKPTHLAEIKQVFDHWKALWPSGATLKEERVAKIKRALDEVGLQGAIKSLDGWRLDDWPERHTSLKAFDIKVLFRSAAKVEQGIDLADNPPMPKRNGKQNAFFVPGPVQHHPKGKPIWTDEENEKIDAELDRQLQEILLQEAKEATP